MIEIWTQHDKAAAAFAKVHKLSPDNGEAYSEEGEALVAFYARSVAPVLGGFPGEILPEKSAAT